MRIDRLTLAALAIFMMGLGHPLTGSSPEVPQEQEETPKEVDDTMQATLEGEVPKDPDELNSFWMEQKLRLTKNILAGVALADFEMIGENADLMRGLNRVERFVRRGPEGYRTYLQQFNLANQALLRQSDAKNLEGVTLAFNQLTISCVNCHRHIRGDE